MLQPSRRAASLLGSIAAIGLCSTTATALPAKGAVAPPSAKVVDVDERTLTLASLADRPALVVYEDKDSRAANAELKRELAELVKREPTLAAVAARARADASENNFWPAQGAPRGPPRREQKREGTTIWLDWTASFREALDLVKGSSNVVLLDRRGVVSFVAAGKLAETTRQALYQAMRQSVR